MKFKIWIALPEPAQYDNMNTYTFTLTEEEANIILVALQELPAKVCNPLSAKLHEQAKEQTSPKNLEVSVNDGVNAKESFA